ncbi:MAG: hypothetical protein GY842_26260 [bacterium]|nr:hypothetical protein [bacterium]
MKKPIHAIMTVAFVLAGWGAVGCKPEQAQESARSTAVNQPAPATLAANLFVPEAPVGARGVTEVKADAGATGAVVVHGRIGGRANPFVDGAAVLLLADASMKACNELHGDGCKTPWDYCCEARESLTANTATIQIVGADGKPLKINLNGRHGLTPLARITVAGEITQRDASGTLVINARSIHVQSSQPG